MEISITELKKNINDYVNIVNSENITVTRYGKPVFVLISKRRNALNNILGAAQFDGDYKNILKNRINEI